MSKTAGLFRSVDLGGGLRLHHHRTRSFKTITARLALHANLDEASAARALVPRVLARGTERFPSLRAVQIELDRLYGASLSGDARKIGDRHLVQFRAEWITDRLAGEPLLEAVGELIGEMLHRPARGEDGRLREAIVAQERKNLADEVAAVYDDKARYAMKRLVEEMCRREPFARPASGHLAEIREATTDDVTRAWRTLVDRAPADLFVVGDLTLAEARRFARNFGLHARDRVARIRRTTHRAAGRTRTVRESEELQQSHLCMGFRVPVRKGLEHYATLILFNALFGGSAVGKLFKEVRERHSLCYAIHSMADQAKGLLLVHAGIEAANATRTRRLVVKQLESLRKGEISEREEMLARSMLLSGIASVRDSAGAMSEFGLNRAVEGLPADLEGLLAAVAGVGTRDVARLARRVDLDTVYVLGSDGKKR